MDTPTYVIWPISFFKKSECERTRDILNSLKIKFTRTSLFTFNSDRDDCSNALTHKDWDSCFHFVFFVLSLFLYGKCKQKKTKQGISHYQQSIACWEYIRISRFVKCKKQIEKKNIHKTITWHKKLCESAICLCPWICNDFTIFEKNTRCGSTIFLYKKKTQPTFKKSH